MIAEQEKISCDREAFFMIARAADGALRDGQRILDQAVTYARGEKITTEMTAEMLGEIDTDLLNRILTALVSSDIKAGVSALENVFEKGFDLKRFLEDIVEAMRNMLIIKTVDAKDMIESGEEQYEFLKKLSSELTKENILYMLQRSLETEQLLSRTSMPAIVMESMIADMIFSLGEGTANIDVKVPAKKEQPGVSEQKIKKETDAVKEAKQDPPEEAKSGEPQQKSNPGNILVDEITEEEIITKITKDVIEKHWDNIIERIKSREDTGELAQAMSTAGVVSYEEPNLMLTGENKFFTDRIKKHNDLIKDILKEEFKADFSINIYDKNEYMTRHKAQKDVAEEEAKNNPTVKELSRIFKISSVEVKNKK
jgi:DNA polymerase-3 subunit gamma/tau